MIKIENVHVGGFEAAIRGMRNPKNSWDKSDSLFYDYYDDSMDDVVYHTISGKNLLKRMDAWDNDISWTELGLKIGPNDMKLMKSLVAGGPVHAKFRRFIDVSMDLTAPFYWWNDFDTYRIGRFDNFYGHDIEYDSCSTMHKIHAKEFTLDDFSTEHLMYMKEASNEQFDDIIVCEVGYDHPPIPNVREDACCTLIGTDEYFQPFSPQGVLSETIKMLNRARELFLQTKDKKYWWQMIQLLPNSYNQKRTVKLNYEVLAGLYPMRKDHKLDEFREFCKWIETLPYAKELIIGQTIEDLPTSPLLDTKCNGGE